MGRPAGFILRRVVGRGEWMLGFPLAFLNEDWVAFLA